MADTPIIRPLVSIWGQSFNALGPMCDLGAPASAVTTPDMVRAFPVRLAESFTVVKLLVMNGATVAGTQQVGVYDENFNLLVSGSAAQSGTNQIQEYDVTDTVLVPGIYYLATVTDDVLATQFQWTLGAVQMGRAAGCWQQQLGAGGALPATATPAASNASVRCVGMSGRVLT